MKNTNNDAADEIVIVIPPEAVEGDEIEIDLDALGIDVENLSDDVNIIIQIEGQEDDFIEEIDDDFADEANEWYFDDDPYGIVYYEFPDDD